MKDIGLITRGVEVAKLFADAHEEEFIQTSLAKEMDLYNNQVGRNIAENYYLYNNYSFPSDDDLATIVKQHVDRGDMRKIFDNRLIPTTKKLPKVENIIKNEWRKNKDDKWIYYDENGNLTTGWKKIYDTWYYFDKNNIMQEGWQYINNNWYYLLPGSGAMQKGWVLVNNVYYYLVDSGEMQEGWLYYNNKYYYLTPGNGDMKKGWQYIGNDYYYFDDSGAMQTGWIYLDAYYYLNTGGQMQTGWKNIDGKTYYFGSDGRMVTGYVYINNVQYYFDSSGALSKSPGSGYNPNKPIIMLGVKKDGVELNV